MARLLEKYTSEIAPALQKELSVGNVMQIPRLTKIVINVGMGDAVSNSKLLDSAVAELGSITGQKPIVTHARKAVAAFRLREGMPIGCKVTLRGVRMYEFLDRLISLALPRIRDFRGVSEKGFDGRGNFTLGLKEQLVFPEIEYEKVASVHGMDISFVNTAQDNEQGIALMRHLGMPFRKA